MVKVPDTRLDWLDDLIKPPKKVEATIDFLDVPGFSHETAQQQGDFRRSLPSVRQSDALVAVVRGFESGSVPPYRNRVDARADLEELTAELAFCDLEQVTGRIERLEKALKKPTRTRDQEKHELELMQRCQAALEEEKPISAVAHSDDERKALQSFSFLTDLPIVVVINVGEEQASAPAPFAWEQARSTILLCADSEEQIAQLDASERTAFLEDLGVSEPARDRLIHACLDALGLISFLTVGDNEVRAWAVPRDIHAVEAAGKIHTDLARGFIRGETVAFDDLKAAGDMKAAKAAGKVRQEGKEYVVQDGDIITFRFNV